MFCKCSLQEKQMIVKLGLIMPPYCAYQTQCFQLKESDHQTMAVGMATSVDRYNIMVTRI